MPIDPHVRRLLDALSLAAPADAAAGGAGPADLGRRREAFRGLMRLSGAGAPVAGTTDRSAPGPAGPLPVRIYTPPGAAETLPGLIYLHGGGFVCGDLDTHDALCRTICHDSGCRVVAVGYRLAPEHPFPAALQDAEAATMWTLAEARALGIDPSRIAIAGDSAGGTLAAALCQQIARTHPGAIALQLLLCPILDWAADIDTIAPAERRYLLDRETMAQELAYFLPAGRDARDPRVSPLRAAAFSGQPPTHIHTAEFDPLYGAACAYADKLREAGVAVRHVCHQGMIHLFYGLGQIVPYARAALHGIGEDLRTALA